ncbi:MAG: glyoxylate/hydroxypyruvate reductase A [Betaproteobacteria bacterium]|nr:glyoxylate/hydroxypyruvate reductase A [Betaproteobacteria bacterium]MDH5352009.1 glyoxylate/hydroxypyruvate reductase A [Betaproteobacteria bacterium]
MNILFASEKEKPDFWFPLLQKALPEDRFFAWPDTNGGDIDLALVATHPPGTFAGLKNLRLIQSLWMGVENIVADPELPRGVPVARLIDPGMVHAMCETVIAWVLDWHRHFYLYRRWQREKTWKRRRQYLPSDRTVGILGLGELGSTVAAQLKRLGFHVAGWSRRPKSLDGVYCSMDLDDVLSRSDAVVCLLPLTAHTRGILGRDALSRIRKDGCVINVARGGHVVIADLLAALDAGHLAHAYLDVFETEPLPQDSPLWTHPGVTVTPHIAALSEPRTSVAKIAEHVERVRRGELPGNLVDFAAGY